MARIRTIKPEFWQDEKLSPLPPIDRLTFLGMISQADDSGRLVDSVRLLDGLLFSMTEDTCGPSIDRLASVGVIRRGTTLSGQKVIQICGWLKHQKIDRPNRRGCLPEIGEPSSNARRKLSPKIRKAILERDEYKCQLCQVEVIPTKKDKYDSRDQLAEIDHIDPLADGGADDAENLRTLCKKCNRTKQGEDCRRRNADASTNDQRIFDERSPSHTSDLRPTINDQRSTINTPRSGVRRNRTFEKPSSDDVLEYCRERNNGVDPQTFIDFYEAKGWKVGNQAMVDWKAAVRTWERNGRAGNGRDPPKKSRVYDPATDPPYNPNAED